MLAEKPRAESLRRWMALFSDERSISSITKHEDRYNGMATQKQYNLLMNLNAPGGPM
jgi:hypothetical protein